MRDSRSIVASRRRRAGLGVVKGAEKTEASYFCTFVRGGRSAAVKGRA